MQQNANSWQDVGEATVLRLHAAERLVADLWDRLELTRHKLRLARAERSVAEATARTCEEQLKTLVASRTWTLLKPWRRGCRLVSRWTGERAVARLLRPHVDGVWYRAHVLDLRLEELDDTVHYLRLGARDFRDPNASFSTLWYLRQNPDVETAGMNPLLHFLRHGFAENRRPHPDVSADEYARRYPVASTSG